jgi:hypothetical protein
MVHKLKAYKTLRSLDYSTESARGTVQYVLCTCTYKNYDTVRTGVVQQHREYTVLYVRV